MADAVSQFFAERGAGLDFARLNPEFAASLMRAVQAAEMATGQTARFTSLARSPETQAQLYANYTQQPVEWGGTTYQPNVPAGQQGLAAPPGRSRHQFGSAADLADGPVLDWLHDNAGTYGLSFLTGSSFTNDPGHIQMAGAPPAEMAYAGTPTPSAGQQAITAAAGPGAGVAATPPPAPGSQRLFRPVSEARAARQAGGTPRLDELSNLIKARRMGDHPLLDRVRNFLQTARQDRQQENPTPPAPIPYAGAGSGRGDPAVAQLQQQLAAAGFDPGPIDGIMGPRTQAAMQAADAAGGLGAPGGGGAAPSGGLPSPSMFDRTAAAMKGSITQAQVQGPAGSKTIPPPPPPNPLRGGGPGPSSGMGSYNPQAPLNYGLPIAPAQPTPIAAPPPGSLVAGSMTPTGPSGLGTPNPAANMNWGIPIQPRGPASAPTPSANPTLGPLLAGYSTPGNGVGVPTTPVSRGVLPNVAPPPNMAAGINAASVMAGMPQANVQMPGWGPVAPPTQGPGAGGRPVTTSPTTTVPSGHWNIPGERERALTNGLMPAGRNNFGLMSQLPGVYGEPNPYLIMPQSSGVSRPVTTTVLPDTRMPFTRTLPMPEFWRRLMGAGV